MNLDQSIEKLNKKSKVAVLGATGVVGQVFISMLADHPWFDLVHIAASASKAGKGYKDEVHWVLPTQMPQSIEQKKLGLIDSAKLRDEGIKIVFSALPASEAKTIEPELRSQGFYLFSNASAMRYEEDVPILIPEINPDQLDLINKQGFPEKGFIVTNANCSTTGLAVALSPLRKFVIEEVVVSTYQSISGAGYPGLASLDIMGNTLPHIPNEEDKMGVELKKILQIEANVFPFCIRIPVLFGHMETVWITFKGNVEKEEILEAWSNFKFGGKGLPNMADHPVEYLNREDLPQPKMSFWGSPSGMQVFTGRLKKEKNRIGFTLLVNNLVKGGAGGSVENAEFFVSECGDKL
jgi:aspartate-semialdehyde dehydrogenase